LPFKGVLECVEFTEPRDPLALFLAKRLDKMGFSHEELW